MVRKLVAVLLAVGASVGAAQEKATELTAGVLGLSYTTCSGCDGLFIASSGGAENGVFSIFSGLGGASIGVGFYVSPGMSIEPTVSFSTFSSSGESLTLFGIGAAVPMYFAKGWGRKGPYLAPRATYNSLSGGGQSVTQFTAGAAIGTKVPLNDMAALRLQANFDYGFESSDVSSTTAFGALMGLSVFLR